VSRRLALLLVLTGAAALAAAPVGVGAGGAQKRTVGVFDNYFTPTKLTVNRGSTVTWRWPDDGGDTHDVELGSAPAGVRKWTSGPAAAAFDYRRKLTRPGLYKIVCTFHEEEMRMQIRVRRR